MGSLDIKKGLTNLTASSLRESPGALPAISRAAHYAGEGHAFMDTMFALGPRAAIGFLRTRASAYAFVCSVAFVGGGYFLTTDRVRLSTEDLVVERRLSQQSRDQSIVKRNRLTGRVHTVEVTKSEDGRPVYIRPHVNRLLYSYNVYKPSKQDWIVVDLRSELRPDRFSEKDSQRGRFQESRAVADAMARGLDAEKNVRSYDKQGAAVKTLASTQAPAMALDGGSIGLSFTAQIERMEGGDLGYQFLVRETMATALKSLLVSGFRECIQHKYEQHPTTTTAAAAATQPSLSSSPAATAVHPVLADLHFRRGTWNGEGISALDVLKHLGASKDVDEALRQVEQQVLERAKWKLGTKAILTDVKLSLRT